jgi:hypothetical protein
MALVPWKDEASFLDSLGRYNLSSKQDISNAIEVRGLYMDAKYAEAKTLYDKPAVNRKPFACNTLKKSQNAFPYFVKDNDFYCRNKKTGGIEVVLGFDEPGLHERLAELFGMLLQYNPNLPTSACKAQFENLCKDFCLLSNDRATILDCVFESGGSQVRLAPMVSSVLSYHNCLYLWNCNLIVEC